MVTFQCSVKQTVVRFEPEPVDFQNVVQIPKSVKFKRFVCSIFIHIECAVMQAKLLAVNNLRYKSTHTVSAAAQQHYGNRLIGYMMCSIKNVTSELYGALFVPKLS